MENSIAIKELTLINFKGLRNQTIRFNHVTNIFGDNGTGKTTIFDAFTWLLFGKDSTDRKDFNIKTLDSQNNVIPQIEHEVSAVLDVSGEEVKIKRILKENWVKKRGTLEAEFSGNVTEYFWNDVPKSQKEFQEKISKVLDELVFKLITNPLAFNSLKWQERRNILLSTCPISNSEIEPNNKDYDFLRSLTDDLIKDEKLKYANQRKKLNDSLKAIPTRIDEVTRNIPEALDFDAERNKKASIEKELKNLDSQLEDKNKAYDSILQERNKKATELFEAKTKLQNIEFSIKRDVQEKQVKPDNQLDELRKELSTKENELSTAQNGIRSIQSKKELKQKELESTESNIVQLRAEWTKTNSEELKFNENEFHCPACKRAFDEADVDSKKEELLKNFSSEKTRKLNDINTRGRSLNEYKESLKTEINDFTKRISDGDEYIKTISLEIENLKSKIDHITSAPIETPEPFEFQFNKALAASSEYQSTLNLIKSLEFKLQETPTVDVSELKTKKQALNNELEQVNRNLSVESQIEASNRRIEELKKEEVFLSNQINEIEKKQFTIDNFIKAKIDSLESMVNKKFRFVKFKLFEIQINGAEVECCDALINGVPFSDANTASKINAGLDIINTLCQFYKVTAPIFIDNRESVVNIVDCQSQIINLIVSEEDKKLRVA